MTADSSSQAQEKVKIWDVWIRAFHWCLAIAVIFLLISGETGWQFFEWHRRVGEGVLVLLLFRLCWSLVGSSNASLIGLFASPRRVFRHLRGLVTGKVGVERGHNAAGGYAVLLMLTLIGFQAISGLFIADEEELITGVFYGVISYAASERLYSLHQTNAMLIQSIVIFHVCIVFLYWVRAGHNLILPMISGRMHWPAGVHLPTLRTGRALVGLVVFCAVLLFSGWLFSWW